MSEPQANRVVYGQTLVELGERDPRIVALDADVAKSTNTCQFRDRFPDRFFNCGVAEQNMICVAAGLASAGKIPFASTFVVFASMRACEQIRTSVAYPRLNVKIVATHGGLDNFGDGVTHQGIEDLAIMRAIRILAEGNMRLGELITHRRALDDWGQAFAACEDKTALKALLTP